MRITIPPAVRLSVAIGMSALLFGTVPTASAQPPAVPQQDTVALADTGARKNPRTARVRAIFPGAGHWYAGERWRGGFVFGGMFLVFMEGLARNEKVVAWPGDPFRIMGECVTSSLDATTYAAAAGLLALSIWDAGRAAERSNARRRRSASLVLQLRPGRGRGHRVGLSLPVGGQRSWLPGADLRRDAYAVAKVARGELRGRRD